MMDITVRITVQELIEMFHLECLKPTEALVMQDQDQDGAITVLLKDCALD